jgi:hypothetical protein
MKIHMRILATSAAVMLLAAACGGGGTGEGAATAAPAVQTAAPAATQAQAQPAAPAAPKFLVVYGDIVRGTAGLTDEEKDSTKAQGLTCVQMSRYPQGSRIVWRTRVLDPLTNKALDDKALSYVRITLADGKTTQDLKYGGHGGTKENPADFFWVTGWTVPLDYPTGLFNFTIQAKSVEGALGTWAADSFKVPSGQLQIIPKDLGKRSY